MRCLVRFGGELRDCGAWQGLGENYETAVLGKVWGDGFGGELRGYVGYERNPFPRPALSNPEYPGYVGPQLPNFRW